MLSSLLRDVPIFDARAARTEVAASLSLRLRQYYCHQGNSPLEFFGAWSRKPWKSSLAVFSLKLEIEGLFGRQRTLPPQWAISPPDLRGDGTFTLRSVRLRIASNWQKLYKDVFGVAPAASVD